MHHYLDSIYQELVIRHPHEKEYLQAVYEFLDSLGDLIDSDPSITENNMIRRMVEPDRIISFKVIWEDDQGVNQVNTGYRVQFNQALGPYKGGIRFHPTVNQSILKFLAFEQTFKNSLTNLPLGGAKGGSDFNPKGKSDQEILRFCRAFMTELYTYLGPDLDIPAGDIGVSSKAVGYMFGMYKRLTHRHHGSFTSKGITYGGSLVRPQATGYGLVYVTEALLKTYFDTSIQGKSFVVSGAGNVAIHTASKIISLGGVVKGMSESYGMIHHDKGIDIELLSSIKDQNQTLDQYLLTYPDAIYTNNPKDLWKIPVDIALPCATENELDLEDVKALHQNHVMAILEGANMPTTLEATHYLIQNKIPFVPGKAANAGGVTVSGLEMQQNAMHVTWDFNTVDQKLKQVMHQIFYRLHEESLKLNNPYDLVKVANILSFKKVYQAMIEQGL